MTTAAEARPVPVESPLPRVSRPALVLASASSSAVLALAFAGYQFTVASFLAAMAGCGVILGLGFTGGRVRRPILEPLDGEWDAVQVAAPSAGQLAVVDPPAA